MPLLQSTEKYRHIVWDWNGTILNDINVALQAVNTLLEENSLPQIDSTRYKSEFGFPVRDFYEKIGFDLDQLDFAALCDRFMQEYDKNREAHGELHGGVLEVLRKLSLEKTQSILSAASQWHLEEITRFYKVDDFFDHIYGIDNNQAGNKIYRGRELIQASGVGASETLMIGDTEHDYEVAEALGIDVMLIADGHQKFERLSGLNCKVLESRYSSF